MKVAKRVKTAVEGYDIDAIYPATEALGIVKRNATAKFDETLEVAFKLGIDPRKQLTTPDGRPVEILDQGDTVKELFE